ncbi:hypothetical protein JQN72_17340 [Phycicoccus sp. CSK15P-2]|uniref:hypothetical protein n=1 Tax=Phycicoccus sp. CSK15P-2 TaxID=2807627 RepID=UPI00195296A4|nr:hypothetical protein [Phycicoccus sp. CSK15P-2]MBM6406010.1 hypothetical protein [Phycicoccus sp. CSK15P-2]
MTDTFTFVSWVRDGVAAAITRPETLGTDQPARAALDVRLVQKAVDTGQKTDVDVTLAVHGPGDVLALDRDEIVRVDPPPGADGVEPHYVPVIEFRRPDLPWLFTPLAGTEAGGQRLRPWLALVVLPEERAQLVRGGGEHARLVCPVRELPDPTETWAWAHAQVVGLEPDESVEQVLDDDPHRARSRLIAARRLLPGRRYLACLVPTFRAGVEAASGDEVTTTTLAPAWPDPDAADAGDEVQLPVFHHWRFTTAEAGGDLESLVRRLTPHQLGSDAVTTLDVSAPGAALVPPGSEDSLLPLGGAVVPAGYRDAPWSGGEWFTDGLRAFFDAAADAATTVVGPPLYGGQHAGLERPPADGDTPRWLRELNLDPRLRTFAGLGVATVQHFQDVLIASAWEQYDQLRESTQSARQAELAREVRTSALHRRLGAMTAVSQLQVTRTASVKHTLPSRVDAALTGAARRLTRPGGPLARRSSRDGGRVLDGGAVVQHAVARAAQPVPELTAPAGSVTIPEISDHGQTMFTEAGLTQQYEDFEATLLDHTYAEWMQQAQSPETVPPDAVLLEEEDLARGAFTAGIALAHRQAGLRSRPTDPEVSTAATAAATAVPTPAELARTLVAGLVGAPARRSEATARTAPTLAAPSFPWPMVAALREVAPRFLALDAALPTESLCLVQAHTGFVESYLVGLNHAMAAELSWRGYPADPRATFFRHFWDRTDGGADIPPLDQLAPDHPLLDSPGGDGLMLAVRGELVRRFPGLVVILVRAVEQDGVRVPAPENGTRQPMLEGRLADDGALFGFDLPATEARGGAEDPGWFVVFRESPTATRFGLDPDDDDQAVPQHLDDLAWSHVLGPEQPGRWVRMGDLPGPPQFTDPTDPGSPPVTWAANGAHMARCFARGPASVAWHADALLSSGPAGEDGAS